MSSTDNYNQKRITKNAIYLYIRTFIIMLVSLYASREILRILGETDYGIYNVVAGIVIFCSFLNTAMASATQRYLTYALGKNDTNEVNKVFNISLLTHATIILATLIVGETAGLWFLNNQMNIPPERMYAAKWVYQLSLINFCLQIIRVPYNAIIIAHERMSFYAYISVVEALLKLSIIYLLIILPWDRIIVYSILGAIATLTINMVYLIFCKRKYPACQQNFYRDKHLYKELLSFSGWNMLGQMANVGAKQGLNILLNIFVGLTANAAIGIVHQVTMATNALVSGFQVAFAPQIVKLYASDQYKDLIKLIFNSSRLSFFLILIIGLPIIIFCDELLNVWLVEVPNYTIQFTQLFVIYYMIDALSNPLWTTINATGNIKRYQLWVSFLTLLNIPFAYVTLKLGGSPTTAVGIRVALNLLIHTIRIIYLKIIINFPIGEYTKRITVKILYITMLSSLFPIYLQKYNNGGFPSLFINVLLSVISISLIIFCIGLTHTERITIKAKLSQLFERR